MGFSRFCGTEKVLNFDSVIRVGTLNDNIITKILTVFFHTKNDNKNDNGDV